MIRVTKKLCSVDGCERDTLARGWCGMHYQRWVNGDPSLTPPSPTTPTDRFWNLTREAHGCIIWVGHTTKRGYGRFYTGGAVYSAHRWVWEQKNGPVPDGMQLDHFFCDTPRCVNPEHVRPVSPRENTLRSNSRAAINRSKTHCNYGHELARDNLYINKSGGRVCRECQRRLNREYYWRMKRKVDA